MENNNQRIIFLVAEDTTTSKIISEILKKNGVAEDTFEDFDNEEKTPKITTVSRAAIDFFDKKITEEKLSALFQKELKVSKENAAGIISGIKVKLIPFGKKITIPPDIKNTESLKPSTEKVVDTQKDIVGGIKAPVKRTNKPTEIKQKSGPDNYREPIE